MGIDFHSARFLAAVANANIALGRVATIGRQGLYLTPQQLDSIIPGRAELHSTDSYSEPFWKELGANEIISFDASPYENATIIHDMNRPIPQELKNQFDLVFDGGSLEHIFNFPVAIKNCMEMTKVGGHLILATPTNNFCGHGFYQFSPELYYRVLSQANGFVLIAIVLTEIDSNSRWYLVPDPAEVGTRVFITSAFPVTMMVIAKKIVDVELLHDHPQQSDYERGSWKGQKSKALLQTSRFGARMVKTVEDFAPVVRHLTMRIRGYRRKRALVKQWFGGLQSEFLTPITQGELTARMAKVQLEFPTHSL